MARSTIVAVTALSAQDQQDRGLLESGIDMWSTKPISIRDLRLRIDRMKAEYRRAERGGPVIKGEEDGAGPLKDGAAETASAQTAAGSAGQASDEQQRAKTESERLELVKLAEHERGSANGGSEKGPDVREAA